MAYKTLKIPHEVEKDSGPRLEFTTTCKPAKQVSIIYTDQAALRPQEL